MSRNKKSHNTVFEQVFFHKFFREKAARDRVRGIPSKKKKPMLDEQQQKSGRFKDEDDPDAEFMVDDAADEADLEFGDDPEEEVMSSILVQWVSYCSGNFLEAGRRGA